MEYLDILDENGNKTGEIRSYEEAHVKGLIHRSVHIWIINSKGQILIQKREKSKQAYPGYWDISAAGHVSAGEESLVAAQKETNEELGIDVPAEEFRYLSTFKEREFLNGGTFISNEFQDVYLVKKNLEISDLKIQIGEVEAVKFIDRIEFERMINGEGELMVPHKEEYKKLLENL